MWHEPALEASTAGLEAVAAAALIAIDGDTHELRGHIAMVVGGPVGLRRHVPPRREGGEIGKGRRGIPRGCRENTEKLEGSMWSTEMEPMLTNLVRPYLYGA